MEERTVTISLTVTVKPEPDITAEDKEATIKQDAIDQAAALASRYDWGIAVVGEISNSTGTEEIDNSKPDYVEE